MAFKPLEESEELRVLRSLNTRMQLSDEDIRNYQYLKKGYLGEKIFDEWQSKLGGKWLTLNSLNLKQNNNFFQIDSSLIFQGVLHNINVKNFEGDYYIENDNWFLGKSQVRNPLEQLKRSEILFKQLLHEHRIYIPIESYLVFVNPDFFLYNANRNLPIVFPSQLNRYKEKLLSTPADLGEKHITIANKIVSLHMNRNPYTTLPTYKFEDLELGFICEKCQSFKVTAKKHKLVCDTCSFVENIDTGVLRSVSEFQLLNPDRKITVKAIYEWCKIIPVKTIRRVLLSHFKLEGNGHSAHYVIDPDKK